MIAEWYNTSGQAVNEPTITLETKSLYKASILIEQSLGLKLIRMSFNWALMGLGNKRILISAAH